VEVTTQEFTLTIMWIYSHVSKSLLVKTDHIHNGGPTKLEWSWKLLSSSEAVAVVIL
jgi:hypothetical protein